MAETPASSTGRGAAPTFWIRAGGVHVDMLRREATVDGRAVNLSARELSLLAAFAGHPRQVLSRQELLSMAWGMDFDPGSNLVDVYVGYLRKKLGDTVIDTVRGAGYRLRAEPAGDDPPWEIYPSR